MLEVPVANREGFDDGTEVGSSVSIKEGGVEGAADDIILGLFVCIIVGFIDGSDDGNVDWVELG